MNRVNHYLGIPEAYGKELGDLRWSTTDAAIEFADGRLFVFKDELAMFLAGFGMVRSLISLGYVLHLLRMLGHGNDNLKQVPANSAPDQINRVRQEHTFRQPARMKLHDAYVKAGRPIRNAGAVCAWLCADISDEPGGISGQEVSRRLIMVENADWAVRRRELHSNHEPPLTAAEFQEKINSALNAFSPGDLEHLLRVGSYPLAEEGKQVAEVVRVPPSLKEVLSRLEQAPQLASAVPFVAQMISALSIPPRRWARDELPLGGYADIASRGRPEQILPGQFALDPDEFTRRFAENELLYFRREEPPTSRRESLVLLLDQGVRTWGLVRPLLAAAALALAGQASRRLCTLHFTTTGSNGLLIDPLETEPQILGDLVGASDFSLNPALALEKVLEASEADAVDVVLLTHPRNLDEPELKAAAWHAPQDCRLFVVSADCQGRIEFSRLDQGECKSITQIRIAVASKQLPVQKVPAASVGERPAYVPWTGNVEHCAFPFWFGLIDKLGELQFDFEGEWIFCLAKDRQSLIAARIDGSVKEIIPHPIGISETGFQWLTLIGVRSGVCLIGADGQKDRITIAHFDCTQRQVSLNRVFKKDWLVSDLCYDPTRHSIVFSQTQRFDLALQEVCPRVGTASGLVVIAARAVSAEDPKTDSWIRVLEPCLSHQSGALSIVLDSNTGELRTVDESLQRQFSIKPMNDGKPALEDCFLVKATLCRDTLLLEYAFRDRPAYQQMALLFPQGRVLATFNSVRANRSPTLSPNGVSIAYWSSEKGSPLIVANVLRGGEPQLRLERGRHHNELKFFLRPGSLLVEIGQQQHLLTWSSGTLTTTCIVGPLERLPKLVRHSMEQFQSGRDSQLVKPSRAIPQLPRMGPTIYRSFAESNLVAMADGLGHITLLKGRRLLCVFFFFRRSIAAWMPDGTCWGLPSFLGRPATPAALDKIGRVLADAEGESAGP